MAGAPKENKNAEKWTEKEATDLFNKALELSFDLEYDFIGEICVALKISRNQFDHIASRFDKLEDIKTQIKTNCEANCYKNGKKGDIVPSLAIMNLKSNHGWTDRVDTTTKGDKVEPVAPAVNVYNSAPPMAESEDEIEE